MNGKPPPVFVQRRTYRRRRMADGARLLPVFGGILFLIPLLWQGDGGPGTARVMIYIFLVWLGLIVLSGVLSRYLTADEDGADGAGAESAGADGADGDGGR